MEKRLQTILKASKGADKQAMRMPRETEGPRLLSIPDPVKKTLLEVDNPEPGKWYDFFDITSFTYKEGAEELSISAFVSLEEKSQKIVVEGAIVDQAKDEILYPVDPVTVSNSNYLKLAQNFRGKRIEREGDIYAVLWAKYDAQEGGKQSAAQEVYVTANLKVHVGDYMDYTPDRPRKEPVCIFIENLENFEGERSYAKEAGEPKDPDHIVIALIRKPTRQESADCDYVCNFGRKPVPGFYDAPRLGVPFRGKLTLKDNCVFASDISTRCILIRKGEQGGAVQMQYQDYFENKFLCNGKREVSMSMDAWTVPYLEPGGMKKAEYDYRQDFIMKIKTGNVTKSLTAVITSDKSEERALYNQILPLIILWGCLEETARIAMADGSEKEIRNIRAGEKIRGSDGSIGIVRNVWTGLETDPCIRLRLKDGRSLLMTQNHPVLTEQGMKRADRLVLQDKVMTGDGAYRQIEALEQEDYQGTVYNLSLEGFRQEEGLLANGIAAGDMECQNSL